MGSRRSSVDDESGFVLVSLLLMTFLLASMGAAALLLSTIDLRSSAHFKTGRQAFFAAEAGILHALGTINGRGVLDFQADIAPTDQWTRLYGADTKTLPSDPASAYRVLVAADSTDPVNAGRITVTGSAPLEARRVLNVRLRKDRRADQGALYLVGSDPPSDPGDQFDVDGNDHHSDLTLNPAGPSKPGIGTHDDAVADALRSLLSDAQKQQVRGLGFSLDPLDPSVAGSQGPAIADLEQVAARILASNPVVSVADGVLPAGTYGTVDQPQITHLTNAAARVDGAMSGAGILIADGDLAIAASADFIGWVIVHGSTIVESQAVDGTASDGSATIAGSLWTGNLVIHAGGSAIIDFCSECMDLADATGNGNNVPRLMSVVSWQEVL
jgi:hypothetical protein